MSTLPSTISRTICLNLIFLNLDGLSNFALISAPAIGFLILMFPLELLHLVDSIQPGWCCTKPSTPCYTNEPFIFMLAVALLRWKFLAIYVGYRITLKWGIEKYFVPCQSCMAWSLLESLV